MTTYNYQMQALDEKIPPQLREKFTNDVLNALTADFDQNGVRIQGQSYSHLIQRLRHGRWKNISGHQSLMEDALSALGFKVVRARPVYERWTKTRGVVECLRAECTVVTV